MVGRNKKGQFIKGHKVSISLRKKISITTKKGMGNPETIKKLQEIGRNRTFSIKTRKKFSQTSKGHTRTRACSELEAIKNDSILGWAKWRKFRKFIFKRDKYKCKICNKKGNATHHLLARKEYPILCFKKWNVITICKSCHIKIEKIILIRWQIKRSK